MASSPPSIADMLSRGYFSISFSIAFIISFFRFLYSLDSTRDLKPYAALLISTLVGESLGRCWTGLGKGGSSSTKVQLHKNIR